MLSIINALKWPLLIVGVLFIFIFAIPGLLGDFISSVFDPPARIEITNTEPIVQRIQSHGTLLSTAESHNGTFGASMRYGAAGVCYVGAQFQMFGNVQTGFDLLLLNADDVRFDAETETLEITLPGAQLTGCTIDPVRSVRFHVWGETAFCPMDDDEMRRIASYAAINSFRDMALSGGILNSAEEDVVDDFTVLFEELFPEYADLTVAVRFKERETPTIDASCTPGIPDGLVLNPQTGAWTRR